MKEMERLFSGLIHKSVENYMGLPSLFVEKSMRFYQSNDEKK